MKDPSVALRYQAMMEDLGQKMEARVWTDSTATMGICGRRGLCKLRHIDTQFLWSQQKVRNTPSELRKIRGEMGPADLAMQHSKVKSLVLLLACESRGEGQQDLRSCEALRPRLRKNSQSWSRTSTLWNTKARSSRP